MILLLVGVLVFLGLLLLIVMTIVHFAIKGVAFYDNKRQEERDSFYPSDGELFSDDECNKTSSSSTPTSSNNKCNP